jgi:hypothetical protein
MRERVAAVSTETAVGDARGRTHNLPAPLSSFIGRERELAQLQGLLAETRLLTLTGVGGVGKTRLALELAATVLEAYPDGVWLVELASIGDAASVHGAVAWALDVRDEPGRPLDETLVRALRTRQMLLLLDNCEHVVGACAALVESLLRACPGLQVLVTSRQPLDLPGEVRSEVPPLATPAPTLRPSDPALGEFEAVRLFVARATGDCQVRPHTGQCSAGGADLPPARRPAARHRAGCIARARAHSPGDRAAAG